MIYMGLSLCVPTGELASELCRFPSSGTPTWLIILIVVISLAVIGGIGFIVYKKVILPGKNKDGYIRQSTEPALH